MSITREVSRKALRSPGLALAIASATILMWSGPVQASLLSYNGSVYVSVYPEIPVYSIGNDLDTGLVSDGGFGFSGSARAIVRPIFAHLLGVYTYGNSITSDVLAGKGNASATASWQDIISVSGASPPDTIRLSFGVDFALGAVAADFPARSYAEAELVVSVNHIAYYDVDVRIHTQTGSGPSANSVSGDWDTFGPGGGTFHVDVPYDRFGSYGPGYYWQIALVATSVGWDGTAVVNAMNTLGLQAVTLPDGSPIPGTLTFDSGLELAPAESVPEPASFAMAGIGALGLLSYVWRGRKRLRGASK